MAHLLGLMSGGASVHLVDRATRDALSGVPEALQWAQGPHRRQGGLKRCVRRADGESCEIDGWLWQLRSACESDDQSSQGCPRIMGVPIARSRLGRRRLQTSLACWWDHVRQQSVARSVPHLPAASSALPAWIPCTFALFLAVAYYPNLFLFSWFCRCKAQRPPSRHFRIFG